MRRSLHILSFCPAMTSLSRYLDIRCPAMTSLSRYLDVRCPAMTSLSRYVDVRCPAMTSLSRYLDVKCYMLDGRTVENKDKLILTEIFPSVQKHDI